MTSGPAARALDAEPVATLLTSLVALVDAALVAGTALGWLDLSAEQTAALVAFVTALSGVVGALLRASVWSPASVERLTRPQARKET